MFHVLATDHVDVFCCRLLSRLDHDAVSVVVVLIVVYGSAKKVSTVITAQTRATLFSVYSIDFFEPYSLFQPAPPIQNQSPHFGLINMIAQIKIIQLIVHNARNNVVIYIILNKKLPYHNDWLTIFNLILIAIIS
jgi:hypothetical protein